MKVTELAQLTGIHQETIRMYRKQGLLHPTKLSNGYYEYSMQDYASLLHLRKLREFSFSIDDIYQTEHEDSLDGYIQQFDKTEASLQQQIHHLQQKIQFIRFEKSHLTSSLSTAKASVSLDQSIDAKIDLYPPFKHANIQIPSHIPGYYFYTTTPIYISKDILNGDIKDEIIQTKVGVGTYRSIYTNLQIPIPKHAIIIPNGLCISQIVTLEDLTHINIKALKPMIDYAKKIQKPFISDTTGYLAGITYKNNKPIYFMRIRACIEENNVISNERMF